MKDIFDLKGRVAVVTGASSGIGIQMAKVLASKGADIAIVARRKEKLEAVAKEIKELGVRCIPIECDITDISQVKIAVDLVKSEFGKIDILVNNAGIGNVGPAETMTDEEWDRIIEVDLSGVFKVAREFGKLMIESRYGRVINTASIFGLSANVTIPTSAYHAAKGGVVNLTRALASEWAKHNITVNSICPGFFKSELTQDTIDTDEFKQVLERYVPMGRYGSEGELDTATLFLASDYSGYVTGVNLPVDGGFSAV